MKDRKVNDNITGNTNSLLGTGNISGRRNRRGKMIEIDDRDWLQQKMTEGTLAWD
jgi:hypothetical protein